MPEKNTSTPSSNATTFAQRRAAREAVEAAEGGKPEAVSRTLRAGLDVEQPVITVVRR